jgi:hypothetical protein
MWRTSRGVDDWTDTIWDDIKTLTNQKTLKDNLLDTKQPKTPAMTLNPVRHVSTTKPLRRRNGLVVDTCLTKVWSQARFPLGFSALH